MRFLFLFLPLAHAELYNAPKGMDKVAREINSAQVMRPQDELNSLVGQFYASARRFIPGVSLAHVPVRFSSELRDREGVCYLRGSEGRIEINYLTWGRYDHWSREELVYHELGHCILKRAHDSKLMPYEGKTVPRSIMNPRMMPEPNIYMMNRDYYLRELFSIKESP